MIGRLEAPGAKLEPVMPGLEKQEIAELTAALAADLLVRHHRDGGELVGHDGQHALLRCGGGDCCRWRGFGRVLLAARPSGARDMDRAAGRYHPAHDRARRRHGDGGELGRRLVLRRLLYRLLYRFLGERGCGGGAEQEQACSCETLHASQFK
ncbi:hypothetical protein ACVJGC_002080 [Bradyrhizobium diazoefficiens]